MAIDNWYDGDTFYEGDERRRLYGGDAPEKKSNQPGWSHALGAAERATELGFTPRQVTDRETFGRQLVAMEAPDGGPTLEAEMLGAGLATGLPSRLGGATNLNEYLSGARAMTGDTGGVLANDPKFMQLTEDARIERLDRLMGGLRDGSLTAGLDALQRRSDPTNSDGYEYVDAAFARGVDNMQGTFYGFADALGQVAGVDVLSEWGQEGVAANVIEAMRNPAKVESYEDIDGLADAGIYALEAVGEFAPQMLTDVAAGIATGGGTVAAKQLLAGGAKALLRKTGGSMATAAPRKLATHGWEAFAPGAKAGAFASAYMQNTGETQNQFAAEGIEAPGEALLIGAGKAALDYAGLDVTLRQAFKGFNKADAGDALKIGDWLKSSAGATLTAFSAESVTEGAQTLMDELAIQGHKPEHEINWTGVVDAMLKGGIGGGTATAAGQVVTRLVGSQTPAVPGANDGLQDTAAEPLRDITAQVLNTPAGEGNWYTRENAEQGKQAATEVGKPFRELTDGSVAVGDQELLDSLSDEPTQADIARVNGYAQTKDEALADPQGAVVVETVDQNGAVLRNQIVGASIAEEVRAAQEQKFPNATTSITTADAAVTERAAAVEAELLPGQVQRRKQQEVFEREPVTAAERTQPKPIDSPEQLIAEAERLGIDPSVHRTDSKGEFGKALLRRVRTGLAAAMGKGEKRSAPIESLAPLAPLVDMAPEELTVDAQRATDSKGRPSVFASRAKLLERFWAAVNEKYGSPEAFGAALDQMDAAELAPIREAFGIEVEADVDYAGLRREVMGRREGERPDPFAGASTVSQTQENRPRPLAGDGDRILRAVMGNPMLRQLLAPERGKRPDGNTIDERLDALSSAQRMLLEAWLERMGVDIGGPNRALFMELVADAVVERAPDPEVGSVLVDDENRSEDGEVTYVPTVSGIDAYRDDKGVRFLRILNSTPLADRNKSGWNDGLSLYVEALAAIVSDNTVGDGVTEQERAALQQARLVAQVLAELGVTLSHSKSALRHVATAFGLTPEVLKRLTDGAQEDGAVALGELVHGTADQRAAKALAEELAARLVTEDGMAAEERTQQLRKEARSEPAAVAEQLLLTLRELGLGHDGFEEFWANEFDARRLVKLEEEGAPLNPAGFSSAQRAAGEEASVDDNPRLLTDQQGSDDTFYGAIGAASLKHWDFSLMPTAEQLEDQLRKHGFRSGRAQAHTELLKGANLLSVPAADGSLAGRIIDAISLTEYAQAGEQVPATPAQAGRNFLETLSRLLAGRQAETRRTEFTATGPREASPSWLEAAVVRKLPSSLVIFLDPASGQPVTLGEALKAMDAGKDAREEALLLQREVDELSDRVDALTDQAAENIAALEEKLTQVTDAPRDQDMKAVLTRWVDLLRGEKIDTNGRKAYPRKPTSSSVLPADAAIAGAFERVGAIKFAGDKTLDEVYTERLVLLGQMKKLRAKLTRARAAWENTGGAIDQEAKVLTDLARGDSVKGDAGGVVTDTEVQALTDGKKGVPRDEENDPKGLAADSAREFDPIIDRPDPLDRVSQLHQAETLAALAREGRLEAMSTASKLTPAPTATPPSTARARKDGATKAARHWWDARTATGIGARFQGLLSTLREAGVPIPELQIFAADAGVPLETQLAQSELTLFEQQLVLDQIAAGESGYFMNADDIPVVFLASRPSLDHQLLDFAHELGHVVKDQVWDGLLAEHRAELMAGFKAQYGFEPQNEVQMHEWFADQFARAVASDAGTLGAQHGEKSLIAKAIAKLLTYLRNIWEKVNGQSPDVNPHFRAFARSLFQGQYRDSRAAAETNIQRVFNASGTTREQRRMTRLQAPGGPVWISADGFTTIRGRKRLDAGDQELDNAVGLLNMGHAAWLVEGNSFWDVDLFVKTEYGVVENVGHGVFQLRDSDGSVQAIHDIKVYTKRKGHGEMLVASILASGESIHIVEAVPEAQAFWNAMGANDGYDQYKNVRLTWGDYVTAKQNRDAGERSNSGRASDVGSAVREESLAADDGRGQGSAGPDDGRSEAETESLDAESLAFIEEFLGKKPKVYNASGIEALNKQAAARNQLLKTQASAFWKKGAGVVKSLAPLYSMVHTRIARINPGLARALFQPANERQSSVGQSWEQRSRALKGRMLAQLDGLLSDLRSAAKGSGLKADAAIQAAFEDAYTGTPKTLFGNRVKRLLEDMVVEAKRAGLRSVDLADLLVASNLGLKAVGPVVFDRQALASRPADFQKLLTDAGIEAAEAREIFNRIVDGPGTLEGAIAPGMPVGMHKTNRELVEKLGYDRLKADGWVLGKHAEALFHWVDGVSKRAAWESIFGETRKGEFDPNAKFIDQLQIIRSEQGENAAQEVLALVNGALGRHPAAQSMPGWFRNAQEFITGWVGMTVLAFSGVASIPELAMPMVRGGGRVSMREMFTDLGEARKFARDMGIVLSDASEQVMWQATGEQYQSPMIRKAQRYFFRYNGNELIVRTSRILATNVAMRYVLKAAAEGDHAALARLNTDAKTVLAWDAAGRPAWSPEQSADLQVISAAVGDAINQFVNEATLNPSRFQATHWGNNPYLKMIWHLKHFLYAMGDTVMLGMYREMKRRWSHMGAADFNKLVAVAMPALIFGLCVLPLAAASMELRDWIRYYNGQQRNEYEGALDYLQQTFSRSGGFGPIEFLINLRENQEQGRSIWGTISPVLGKGDMLFGAAPAEEKLRAFVPIWSQNKTLFGLLE